MLDTTHDIFVKKYINYKLNNFVFQNKYNKFYYRNKIYLHHKYMPDYVSFGIKIVSFIFILTYLILKSLGFNDCFSRLFRFSSTSNFFLLKNYIRFYDSIFELTKSGSNVFSKKVTQQNLFYNKDNDFDFVIIGSGPGGSIAAQKLRQSGFNTCIVESGNSSFDSFSKPFSYTEMLTKYKHASASTTIGNAPITFVEGCTLGGGSEINSGLYHRIPDYIIKHWVDKYKVTGLSKGELLPFYKELEEQLKIGFAPKHMIPKSAQKLVEGAKKLNWSCEEVPRWQYYDPSNIHKVSKMTMRETYLKKYVEDDGLILENTKVISVKNYNRKKWSVCLQNGKLESFINTDNVIFSGGTISTASILKKSKLSKNAGSKFEMHPTIKVTALFEEKVNFSEMGVPAHQVKEFSPEITFGCSISSKPYLRISLLDYSNEIDLVEDKWEYMAIYYVSIIPQGSGSILNPPVFNDPVLRYNITDRDLRNLGYGLKQLLKLLLAAGAKKLYPAYQSTKVIKTENDISMLTEKLDASKLNLMSVHLFSSCPIGENKDNCVADSYGKIFEKEGLYISDGSMLPSSPGVNPQGAIMSLALRNVSMIIKSK